MKNITRFILVLILIFGCDANNRKEKTKIIPKDKIVKSIKRIDSISGQELEMLIKVPIRKKFNEKYFGYYSFTTNEKGQKNFNGDFEFTLFNNSLFNESRVKIHDTTSILKTNIKYYGTFINGEKNGTFKEILHLDDGVDLYSKWTVSIDFKKDSCSKGIFKGNLGHIMPESTYKFEKINTCTFQFVVDKALERWKEERLIKLNTKKELDTLNIDSYHLLFFRPNEMEFEELLKEFKKEREGLYEVDSDFGFYVNKVYDSISKTDLKVKIITERIVKFSTRTGIKYFDRLKNDNHPYGIIFNNVECIPKIEFGVMTDIGILQELAEYNKNCK